MKKLLTGILATATLVVSVPMFAAFEAHVVNVTATIENGVITIPTSIEYGTVFPQERLDETFDVKLSDSFIQSCNAPIGVQYASGFSDNNQGVRKNGTAVTADRIDPNTALGVPQTAGNPYDTVVANSFFSLGFKIDQAEGGSIVLSFDDYVVDGPGPDDIKIFEVTGGTSYPDEKIKVEVSQDGISWTPAIATGTRDVEIDMATIPLPWIKYIRITDVSDIAIFESTADGYDLDGVRATSQEELCGEISYMIRQKPKCGLPIAQTNPKQYSEFAQVIGEDQNGTFICPENFEPLPLLCPYLSKHEITDDSLDDQENDQQPNPVAPFTLNGINAFHGLPGPWNLQTTIDTQVVGLLSTLVDDVSDTWNVDLRVPCFAGSCAQDWPAFVKTESGDPNINFEAYKADPNLEHELFGCDLWVEVTGINENQNEN